MGKEADSAGVSVRRAFFYERRESPDEVRYTWRTERVLLIYPILAVGGLLLILPVPELALGVYVPLMFGYCVWSIVANLGARREITEAARRNGVTVKGSKWSFTNPLITVIEGGGQESTAGGSD